jgi:3-oxo-4-pregnene-20-carboxyl-CoA dehydrogenase alpha subunit
MRSQLCDEAVGLADALRRQVRRAGGVDLLRNAVVEPASRKLAERLLSGAGVWELEPLTDPVELEAAAAASLVAGEFALPYPVTERLAHQQGHGAILLVSLAGTRQLGSHVDLDLGWAAVDLAGNAYDLTECSPILLRTKLGPFAGEVTARKRRERQPRVTALAIVLQCWWLLGLLKRAVADTVEYTGVRTQFGRPLRGFQSVSFGLADMSVAVDGLEELAKYALWSLREDAAGEIALTDALSLRVAALEAAGIVMRGAHQYHGAMGFTDEVDVSWLSRASHFVRRLPDSESVTQELLAAMISDHGFEAFTVPGPQAAAR